MDRPTDSEFDWGDESELHRVGRGAKVVVAFAVVAVAVAAFAAIWSALFGILSENAWVGLFAGVAVLIAIGGAVEFVRHSRRRDAPAAPTAWPLPAAPTASHPPVAPTKWQPPGISGQ